MKTVFLGLGSNLGDRAENIRMALELLDGAPGVEIRKVSALLETAPVGGPKQPDYLNAAAELATTLAPEDLLATLKRVEKSVGRIERQRWGPREVDLDILLYGDEIVRGTSLEVPHPRMCERAFVLEPLAEIAPEAVHPVTGMSVNELLVRLRQRKDHHAGL